MSMVALSTTTLGSNQATVSFSSISSSYKDLFIVCHTKTDAPSSQYWLEARYNDDTGSNYGATGWQNQSSGGNIVAQYTASSVMRYYLQSHSQFNGGWIYIPNYANTTGYKISHSIGNADTTNMNTMWNEWRSTAAITKVTLSTESAQNFLSGSIFSLYGVG